MLHLPWLVTYGLWAFGAAAVAAVLLGAVVGWARPRLAARDEARRWRARLGVPRTGAAGFAEGEVVTLRGVLRAVGAPGQRFEDGDPTAAASVATTAGTPGGAPAASARAERLALCDEASGAALVELVGPIEVVVGAREARSARRFRALPEPAQARVIAAAAGADGDAAAARLALADARVVLRSLGDGAPVRVRGVLRREASGEATGSYRGRHTATWTLAPEGSAGLPLVSEEEPHVTGPGRRSLAGWAMAGGAALLLLDAAVTGGALRAARRPPAPVERGSAWPLPSTQLAAAGPLTRGRALQIIQDDLDDLPGDDAGTLDLVVALAELRGGCDRAAARLVLHGAAARAAALARRCGSGRAEAQAEYLSGHFEDSSRALRRAGRATLADEVVFDLRAHLLAGRRDAAAEAARAALELPVVDRRPGDALLLSCLADALAGRDGDDGRAGEPDECALLRADARRGQARLDLVAAHPWDGQVARGVAELLAAETRLGADGAAFAGDRGCPPSPVQTFSGLVVAHPALLFARRDRLVAPAFGLVVRVRDALVAAAPAPPPCPRMAQLAAGAAIFAALAGDHREARRSAALAGPDGADGEAFAAAIALRAGDTGPVRALGEQAPDGALLRWLADLHDGLPVTAFRPRPTEPAVDWDLHGAANAALERDGAGIVAMLRRHEQALLPALLPLLVRHLDKNAELVRDELRWGARAPCWSCPPEQVTFDLARRRDAAEAFGDAALARDLDEVTEAFRRAVSRRDVAVPLFVLATLATPAR
jgi:hypothetical protein